MIKPLAIQVCCFLLLALPSILASSPLTLSPNRRFTQAGALNIITTQLKKTPQNLYNFTLNYLYPTQHKPILAFVVLDSLTYQLQEKRIDIGIQTSGIQSTSLGIHMRSRQVNYIRNLWVRYYIAQKSYGSIPFFSSYSGKSTIGRMISSDTPYIYTFSGLANFVDMQGGVETFYALTGFDIIATNDNKLNIFLTVVQTTSDSVVVTIHSYSSQPTFVNQASYTWMSYSKEKVNSPNFAYFALSKIETINGSPIKYKSQEKDVCYDFNVVFGLTGFSVQNQEALNFRSIVNGPQNNAQSSLEIQTTNHFIEYTFTVLTFQTFYCSQDTPFLFTSECFKKCPLKTFENHTTLNCMKCPQDCKSCKDSQRCDACPQQSILSVNTSRCISKTRNESQKGLIKSETIEQQSESILTFSNLTKVIIILFAIFGVIKCFSPNKSFTCHLCKLAKIQKGDRQFLVLKCRTAVHVQCLKQHYKGQKRCPLDCNLSNCLSSDNGDAKLVDQYCLTCMKNKREVNYNEITEPFLCGCQHNDLTNQQITIVEVGN